MIVLHAGVCEQQLYCWGEIAALEQARPARRGKSATPHRVLPYDAGLEQLSTALASAGITLPVKPGAESLCLWLPTVQDTPLASSSLIAEPPASVAKATLAPWTVTAVPLAMPHAVEILCASMGKPILTPGVVVGSDLAFWATVLRFAGTLTAQHQFLPSLAWEPGKYRAHWQPVFVGAMSEGVALLTKAMPHACRALTRDALAPPQTPAASVLTSTIGAMVDQLVRSSTNGTAVTLAAPAVGRRQRTSHAPSFSSVHDQWLYRLRTGDGTMDGEAETLSQFVEQVGEWQRPIAVEAATPFRLCLRLEEPPTPGEESLGRGGATGGRATSGRAKREEWYVRYLLQATDDPSLLLETQQVWGGTNGHATRGRATSGRATSGRAKKGAAALHQHNDFNVREYLLGALGQVTGICPEVETSLKTATPQGYALDSTGAYQFLTDKAQALELCGVRVLLPAWWTRKGTKLRLAARAQVRSPQLRGNSGLSLDAIAEFQWQVALGDEVLSLEELQALATLKQPLVRVRGQWVQMSAAEIETALAFWKNQAATRASVRDVVRMALGAGQPPGGMEFDGVTAEGWIAELVDQLDGRVPFTELPPPPGFHGTLRPYQTRGYSWLEFLHRWGLGACLADDMGLGKTIQTLSLLQREWEGGHTRPVLLICPTSVVGNWSKEAARFTPDLPVLVHHGLTRAKSVEFITAAQQHALILSSYALLHRDFAILKEVPWAGVILDEAQNIKNPETKQAKAARALVADYRVALTGTPVENNIGDLWSIMEFLNPGFLGNQSEFKRRFFVPIQARRDPDAVTQLKRLTGPFILRRLKTDKSIITDLPEKMEMKVFCTLTKEQASLYAAVVKEAVPTLDAAEGIQRRGVILATLSKLKQVCNHPTQFLGDNSELLGRSGKLARLTEMLEEIIPLGERVLIFTQFTEMGTLLRRHLQEHFGREVLFLHGGTTKPQRDRMVERFQAEGEGPQVFLLSLKAGGTGLNLTRATHVFHFDRWWNPAVENQATDRAFRIGQTKNVQVHKFLCIGTLEEKIDEMIERKQAVAEAVVGTGEGWLTELSTTALKELFALRKEAVSE